MAKSTEKTQTLLPAAECASGDVVIFPRGRRRRIQIIRWTSNDSVSFGFSDGGYQCFSRRERLCVEIGDLPAASAECIGRIDAFSGRLSFIRRFDLCRVGLTDRESVECRNTVARGAMYQHFSAVFVPIEVNQ